jgi:hypothetical protein
MASKLSIRTTEEIAKAFKALATGNTTQSDVMEYLLSLNNFRVEPTGTQKVEMQLKQWLCLGHDRKITQTDLQRVTGSNLRIVKNVLAQYEVEVQAFNKALENG